MTPAERTEARAAYRAAFAERLRSALTPQWRWSRELAEAIGASNAQVLEQAKYMLQDGALERVIVKIPRPRRSNGPRGFRTYFRLPGTPAPPAPVLPPPPPERPARGARPATRGTAPAAPRFAPRAPARVVDPVTERAIVEGVISYASRLDVSELREINADIVARGMIPAHHDRVLLAITGKVLGRRLERPEILRLRERFIEAVRRLAGDGREPRDRR